MPGLQRRPLQAPIVSCILGLILQHPRICTLFLGRNLNLASTAGNLRLGWHQSTHKSLSSPTNQKLSVPCSSTVQTFRSACSFPIAEPGNTNQGQKIFFVSGRAIVAQAQMDWNKKEKVWATQYSCVGLAVGSILTQALQSHGFLLGLSYLSAMASAIWVSFSSCTGASVPCSFVPQRPCVLLYFSRRNGESSQEVGAL